MSVLVIRLDAAQAFLAFVVAAQRVIHNVVEHNAQDRRPTQDDRGDAINGIGNHVNGCCGESVVSFKSGLRWNTETGFLGKEFPDVGTNVQVRTTKYATGRLVIRDDDPDLHRFVLVTGVLPTFCIRGWYWAGEAKRHREWWTTEGRDWGFWVPQSALRPFAELT